MIDLGLQDARYAVIIRHILVCGIVENPQATIFADREGQAWAKRTDCGVKQAIVAVGLLQREIKPKSYIPAKKCGFQKAKIIVDPIRTCRNLSVQRLPSANKVSLAKAKLNTGAGIGRKAEADRHVACGRFLDIGFDHNLIGARALTRVDIHVREKAQRANAVCGLTDGTRVEGVALDDIELATDHTIKGGGVAFNINAFDKNPRPASQDKLDIECEITVIAGDARINTQKINPILDCQALHSGD